MLQLIQIKEKQKQEELLKRQQSVNYIGSNQKSELLVSGKLDKNKVHPITVDAKPKKGKK